MPRKCLSLAERIFSRSIPEPNTGCWLWFGRVTAEGYGALTFTGGARGTTAQRASYEAFIGPIPAGLTIDHRCRVRCCVNPDHLEAVTVNENNRRSMSPSARNARRAHCVHGHEFTAGNTYMHRGRRMCRVCINQRSRAYRQSKKEAA